MAEQDLGEVNGSIMQSSGESYTQNEKTLKMNRLLI